MPRRVGPILTVLLIALALAGASGQTTATALFQEALMLERAEGKLREAALLYERLIKEFPSDREFIPKALLQLGGAYEKLGKSGAREAYERILREFADEGTVAAEARARLAGLPVAPAARLAGVVSKKVLSGAGADRYGSVSRDGRFLSFMDRPTGDLALRDLTTGHVRRLTNNPAGAGEFAEYSRFSPNGDRLAYGWCNAKGEYELRVISRDGREPRQLYAREGVSWLMPYDWSPDGREILAILPRGDRTRQLILVTVSDGTVRVLKTLEWNMGVPVNAEFSPDGRVVVYDRQRSETNSDRDVYMLAVDGTRETALADGPGDDSFLGWFPDGNAILFSSDRSGTVGAWVVAVDERGTVGEPRLLRPDLGTLEPKRFTRSGDFFYFKNVGGPDVYLAEIHPASGRVTRHPAPLRERSAVPRMFASWSPDGERLAYRVMAGKPVVAIHDVKTDIVRTVPLQMSYLGPRPSWTADGGLLVTGLDARAREGVYRADLTNGAVAPVLTGVNAGEARLSGDGRSVVFVRQSGGELQVPSRAIIVWNRDTGERRELLRGEFGGGLAISPDGQSLAIAIGPQNARAVHIVALAGGASRVVLTPAPGESLGQPTWTPDGSALLIARGAQLNELWRIPVDSGTPQRLDMKLPRVMSVSVNPDGRRLAIVATQQTPEVWVLQNLGEMRGAR